MNQRELLFISTTIFLTIVAWVLFEVYGIQQTTPTDTQIQTITLNYTIDTTVFDILRSKLP